MLKQDDGGLRVDMAIRENQAKLDGCSGGHDFEPVDDTPARPPRPPRHLRCRKCDGHIAARVLMPSTHDASRIEFTGNTYQGVCRARQPTVGV